MIEYIGPERWNARLAPFNAEAVAGKPILNFGLMVRGPKGRCITEDLRLARIGEDFEKLS